MTYRSHEMSWCLSRDRAQPVIIVFLQNKTGCQKLCKNNKLHDVSQLNSKKNVQSKSLLNAYVTFDVHISILIAHYDENLTLPCWQVTSAEKMATQNNATRSTTTCQTVKLCSCYPKPFFRYFVSGPKLGHLKVKPEIQIKLK